ncbi:hypothetical protein P355_4153 [Burkholderia cenocepacia KC-01]|nr:hypothetical protein P355_4153 [Burkholderia cenocepacia KC-01]
MPVIHCCRRPAACRGIARRARHVVAAQVTRGTTRGRAAPPAERQAFGKIFVSLNFV